MVNLIIKTVYATRVDAKEREREREKKNVSKTNPLNEKLFLPVFCSFHFIERIINWRRIRNREKNERRNHGQAVIHAPSWPMRWRARFTITISSPRNPCDRYRSHSKRFELMEMTRPTCLPVEK